MKYIVYERGWNVDYYEVEAESKGAAIEAVNKSEVDISYSDFSNTEVGTINADEVSCKCKGNCEQNDQCVCNKMSCGDDEEICKHSRGCLHGDCNCGCEF
tara:strand:- start:288 stop:587 length:300 start_codon:yes stop_codon:yes gene_type:complete